MTTTGLHWLTQAGPVVDDHSVHPLTGTCPRSRVRRPPGFPGDRLPILPLSIQDARPPGAITLRQDSRAEAISPNLSQYLAHKTLVLRK
ncbi:MAG: hypothetical protein ABW224_20610 [Kibdelosporangium sp.]